MKIIDRLLIKSFIPPFAVTFFIAIFVLMMQFLWKWIDEIAGKGVGLLFIVEMLAYMCISLIPMALPMAVLISSVMVMGNLAEHYELSSLKSTGTSLARIMLPLMFLTFGISVFSYICSDRLIPISNLKYQSRLYDIKNQKPTLSLEQGVFNNDFQGFSIRIKDKKADNKSIEDVLMYDQSQGSGSRFSQVSAKSGEMTVTADERFFVMRLFDGTQYLEAKPTMRKGKPNYPFVRTSFKTWTKVFDLGEFQLDRTDENLFKTHHNMLSTKELVMAIDSIERQRQQRIDGMTSEIERSFYQKTIEEEATENAKEEEREGEIDRQKILVNDVLTTEIDSVKSSVAEREESRAIDETVGTVIPTEESGASTRFFNSPKQLDTLADLSTYVSFYQTFRPKDRSRLLNKGRSKVTGAHQAVLATIRAIDRTYENRIDHLYHLHNKFSVSVACFIFLFIGAPMGAIVRKGGFGYPLLISVVFFVVYIMMTILFKKMMEGGAIDPILGAWMPCLIILPIGIFLTTKAMNDSKLLPSGKFMQSLRSLGNLIRNASTKKTVQDTST
ncbi:MAG: LptF/LptG family permease [Bacteroidota bacterium]